ncbi:MAG: DUF5060 domain-containing protein [Armatimonadota bacterium]|nr:DUF5060 domain-containing protein [Armatimonadota bacterium]MDR7452323.1 DUF5060 domain-containing protein [Armatimonadota bacterium]MDR7467786.1 DUF5060 domain-containing protein [Armatimonadota bacterium]MDR7494628.1 DUF5060 domain-containing protein [Armatimonadota bacterium]MDR7499688.1 DUF5060 domain-containing protein [Armatimonadota bacterium]
MIEASRPTDLFSATPVAVPKWTVHEISLTAIRPVADPYRDVTVTATFTGPSGERMTVRGFWDGGATYRIRFTPTAEGEWRYSTASSPPDAGLETTGILQVGPPPAGNHGFLRRDEAHPHSFVWDDGTRYFMWGQTYYQMVLAALAGDPWRAAVDATAAHGMNKIRLLLTTWCAGRRVGVPCAAPFAGGDHDTLDLPYWRAFDTVIRYLEAAGLVADVILFTDAPGAFGTPAQDERYVRYALARYGAFHHVIWTLTNEWEYTDRPQEYWNAIGAIVRNEDPWMRRGGFLRPLSIHQRTRIDFQFFGSSWPVHAVIQYGLRNRRYIHGDEWGHAGILFNRGRGMPVVNDEYGYIGERPQAGVAVYDRDQHRRAIWGIALAGGFGSAGDCGLQGCDGTAPIFTTRWLDRPEYTDIGHLVRFWAERGIPYWTMTPANALVRSGDRIYVLADPGAEYVVYTATGAAFSLALPSGTYRYEWFDPATGTIAGSGTVAAGAGARAFTPPQARDLVLHLKK